MTIGSGTEKSSRFKNNETFESFRSVANLAASTEAN